LPALDDSEASIYFGSGSYFATNLVPNVNVFGLITRNQETGFRAAIIAPDDHGVSGELVWEPIHKEGSGLSFEEWRLWVQVAGQSPIVTPLLPAPWILSDRYAFPNVSASLSDLPSAGTYSLTPLDLSGEFSAAPASEVPTPRFAGPEFAEWYALMTDALIRSVSEIKHSYRPTDGLNFESLALTNNPLEIRVSAPPRLLMPRWEYQLNQLVGAMTLDQAQFTNSFPIFRSVQFPGRPLSNVPGLNRIGGARSANASSSGDNMGTNWLREEYLAVSSKVKEELKLSVWAVSRPQAEYFPNDRVRIGLMTDEAEILAAIRSGSTNQVFGAVAQP
jgi:hypothetical protein